MRPSLTTCVGYLVFECSGEGGGGGGSLNAKIDLDSSEMAGNKSKINKRKNNFNS